MRGNVVYINILVIVFSFYFGGLFGSKFIFCSLFFVIYKEVFFIGIFFFVCIVFGVVFLRFWLYMLDIYRYKGLVFVVVIVILDVVV